MEIVRQVSEVINISTEDVERKIKSGSSDQKLWSALEYKKNSDPIITYDEYGYITSYLQNLYITDSSYVGAGIITRYKVFGNVFKLIDQNDFFNSDFYNKVKKANGSVVWEDNYKNSFDKKNYITVARLECNGATGDELGVSVLELKPEFFGKILKKVSIADKGDISLYLIASDGGIVADTSANKIEGTLFKDNTMLQKINSLIYEKKSGWGFTYYNKNMVFYDKVTLNDWLVIAVLPDKIISEPITEMNIRVLTIALISILISMIVALIMSRRITNPISNIISVMKKAESGNLSVKCEVKGKDEMAFLGESFNKMMEKLSMSNNELQSLNKELEERVEYRTLQLKSVNKELVALNMQLNKNAKDQEEKNIELENALDTLKQTQKHLVQSEKMAALGSMMSGIAHEINTPVGVSVTAITFLLEKTKLIVDDFNNNKLKKSSLDNYMNIVLDSTNVIYTNLYKASNLIKSFKRVSVDVSNEQKSAFNVLEYLNNIILALSPEFKGKNYNIQISCNSDLEMYSYPGAISQIFTNLIMNSIIHGFERGNKGNITINVRKNDETIVFEYSDDGIGISEENIDKIFDVFFTTKRLEGGTGLGLNIIFNIVTQNLEGTIQVKSKVGVGTTFIIEIPLII